MRDSGNGQHDDQRYRTDQRLFRQHDLPCDQRSARMSAGDQGTSPGGNAGKQALCQHQRTALKIQQSRSLVFVVKGTRNIFFSDFLVQLQRAATLYGYNGIVSYLDENANEIDAAEKILREINPKA